MTILLSHNFAVENAQGQPKATFPFQHFYGNLFIHRYQHAEPQILTKNCARKNRWNLSLLALSCPKRLTALRNHFYKEEKSMLEVSKTFVKSDKKCDLI